MLTAGKSQPQDERVLLGTGLRPSRNPPAELWAVKKSVATIETNGPRCRMMQMGVPRSHGILRKNWWVFAVDLGIPCENPVSNQSHIGHQISPRQVAQPAFCAQTSALMREMFEISDAAKVAMWSMPIPRCHDVSCSLLNLLRKLKYRRHTTTGWYLADFLPALSMRSQVTAALSESLPCWQVSRGATVTQPPPCGAVPLGSTQPWLHNWIVNWYWGMVTSSVHVHWDL